MLKKSQETHKIQTQCVEDGSQRNDITVEDTKTLQHCESFEEERVIDKK